MCVTGGAGDIGSALVKALLAAKVRSVILVDSSEHGLFEVERELQTAYTDGRCTYVLGNAAEHATMEALFRRLRPEIVFHAAAFKHVSVLEQNPFSAVENNAIGAHAVLNAAAANGVAKFVLISTDKAVAPHSVMGVSKRIAELMTVSMSSSVFRASAIRLANVIGSRGSVTPIFWEDAANGRPLRVTHADASRYFLSRQEAVNAILAAGAAGRDGKVLVPELPAPVRIADLAAFLANGAGVRFTGLKPGEKLSEDLTGEGEIDVGMVDGRLRVIETTRLTAGCRERVVMSLRRCVAERDRSGLAPLLCEIVPDYVPSVLMRESAAALA